MSTILVPLDGSALAEQILPYARALAPLFSARIHLLQVITEPERDSMLADSITGLYGMGEPPARHRARTQIALEEARAHAEGYLAAHASQLQEEGLDVDVEVRIGPPADIILEVAKHEQITLIAMATHGYSGLRRWALGSVADRVVQAAPAPVFLIRDAEQAPTSDSVVRRILVPLDGSDLSRQALPFAAELATCAHADLTLLQAASLEAEGYLGMLGQSKTLNGAVLTALHQQAQHELAALVGELRQQDISAAAVVLNGSPAEVIVDEAARRAASAIVMATHGRGGLRRWALGSVADKVLHAAHTPLVLVRAR